MMRGPRVLIVDHDRAVRTLLRRALAEIGYRVDEASEGGGALPQATEHAHDLVVLGIDSAAAGLETIRRIRERSQIPIVALSGRGDEDVAVAALASGADDFIPMPFNIQETVARVENALRRRARQRDRPTEIVTGDLQIDLLHRRVRLGDRNIRVPVKTFEVLRVLAESRGRTLTHREILRAVWGRDRQHRTQYLRVAISGLRRQIEPDPSHPTYVITEPGLGYRLAMPPRAP